MDDGDKIKMNDFKTRLLAEQAELELEDSANAARAPVALDQTRQGRLSRMDAMQQRAMALATEKRRALRLTLISAALDRIAQGAYGYCAICDEDIEIRRLTADPATPFCRAHAR